MLRVRNNTKYAPFKLRDMIMRDTAAGCTNLINDNLYRDIGTDWFYYLTQTCSYNAGYNTPITTNIITAYIFDNFKDRVMLEKYADEFDFWDESTDFPVYVDMVKQSISYTLKANTEKYNKLYYAMIAEFNPLWNVDGTEITERELTQTGHVTDTKTGTDTTSNTGTDTTGTSGTETTTKRGTDTETKTGTDTATKTGTQATADTGTEQYAKAGTEALGKSGTETLGRSGTETTAGTGGITTETSNTTYDSSTYYGKEKTEETRNTTDTKTLNTTDTNTIATTDTTTYNTTDTKTLNTLDTVTYNVGDETQYNTTDEILHNTTDELTVSRQNQTTHDTETEIEYNSSNRNDRELVDTETIKHTRQGNIGVTTTTKLLTEYIEYSKISVFMDTVARDIVNTITYMTY